MKIDGREIAKKILADLKSKVQKLSVTPHLAIILVGNDPASHAYVRQKRLKANLINATTTIFNLKLRIQSSQLEKLIDKLNSDNSVHGIIVQQPLSPHINIAKIAQAIDPHKDVDGFHPKSKFQPPIALAVLRILERVYRDSPRRSPSATSEVEKASDLRLLGGEFRDWLTSKKIIVIGKGETGGKPVIQTFKKVGVQATTIDSKTKNPKALTKTADIIISAVGKSHIVKPDMLKKGVVLISIGLHKGLDGKLHGDYDEKEIKNIVSFYTPTPGGVGPVNVAMLLKNLIRACENFSR